jgi:hypothetical protein
LTERKGGVKVSSQVKIKEESEGVRTLLEGRVRKSLGKIEPDLRVIDFGIINCDACPLGKEIANERDGG